MLDVGAAPRFYHAFYRWSSTIAPRNHVARSHRLSLGQSRQLGTVHPDLQGSTESKTDDGSGDSNTAGVAGPRIRRVRDTSQTTLPVNSNELKRGAVRLRPSLREQKQQEELGNGQIPEYLRLIRRDIVNKSPARRAQISKMCRSLMRHVPSGVVVITSRSALGDSHKAKRASLSRARAMTVSSFTTVSLDPTAIVSFNIKVPSSTWDAIRGLQQLRIHFLTASRLGATIANTFSKNRGTEAFEEAIQQGIAVGVPGSVQTSWNTLGGFGGKTIIENFNFKRRRITNTGEINHSTHLHGKAIYAALDCKLLEDKCVYIHDHVIVVAEVFGIERTYMGDDTAYLSYFDGHYRRASARIDMQDKARKNPEPSIDINADGNDAEPLLRELTKRGFSDASWQEGNGYSDGQKDSSNTELSSEELQKEESQFSPAATPDASPDSVSVADGQEMPLQEEGREEAADGQETSSSGEEDKSIDGSRQL